MLKYFWVYKDNPFKYFGYANGRKLKYGAQSSLSLMFIRLRRFITLKLKICDSCLNKVSKKFVIEGGRLLCLKHTLGE
jgi:hypothetical protein